MGDDEGGEERCTVCGGALARHGEVVGPAVRVGWHCSANKCEGLTSDHQLMKRCSCYPKASLDWAGESSSQVQQSLILFFTYVLR